MSDLQHLKLNKIQNPIQTKHFRLSPKIFKSKKKKINVNRIYKEKVFKQRVTRKIKKKGKKPFRNLRKILNVIYREKESNDSFNFKGDIKPDVTVLYLIICKFISDNKKPFNRSSKNFQSINNLFNNFQKIQRIQNYYLLHFEIQSKTVHLL